MRAHGVVAHEHSNRKRCPLADWIFQRRQPPNGTMNEHFERDHFFLWPKNQHNQNVYTNEKQKITTKTNNRIWTTNWTGYHAQPTSKHPNFKRSYGYGPLIGVAVLLRLVTPVGDTEQQSARMQLHQAMFSTQHQRCRQPTPGRTFLPSQLHFYSFRLYHYIGTHVHCEIDVRVPFQAF